MDRLERRLAVAALSAALFLGPARAGAEGFFDLYVSGSFHEFNGVSGEDGIGGGLRGGGYFEVLSFLDLGLAGDLAFFKADGVGAPINTGVFAVTPMFMVRVPLLETDRLPHGMIQPYAGVGPGLFTVVAYGDNFALDAAFEVGVDFRLGTKVMLLPWLGLFLEYGYTGFTLLDVVEVKTNHVKGGVGFNF